MERIRIATRGSALARWQAEHVARRLAGLHPGLRASLVVVKTRGDVLLSAPLASAGGKGLFIEELERALHEERADVAVHSMKDVPVEVPAAFRIPVLCAREDPRDVLVSAHFENLDALPEGAMVGTSSLRRQCQVRALRPDLRMRVLRGNVDTRLRRLDAGDFDAILLAGAGLKRLGWESRISEYLDPERCLPSAGQGAMGIECRTGDEALIRLIAGLHDPRTAAEVGAERAMNRRLGSGCQAPVAALAVAHGAELHLSGLVGSVDGTRLLRAARVGRAAEPEALGEAVAGELLAQGARELLDAAYAGG